MDVLKLIFLFIHLIMVVISGFLLVFSNNRNVLIVMTIILIIVLGSCLYFDGCIVSKLETTIPFINKSPTEIIKMLTFIDPSVRLQDVEKILISVTLVAFSAKLAFIYIVEEYYNQSFTKVISQFKNTTGVMRFIHDILV